MHEKKENERSDLVPADFSLIFLVFSSSKSENVSVLLTEIIPPVTTKGSKYQGQPALLLPDLRGENTVDEGREKPTATIEASLTNCYSTKKGHWRRARKHKHTAKEGMICVKGNYWYHCHWRRRHTKEPNSSYLIELFGAMMNQVEVRQGC